MITLYDYLPSQNAYKVRVLLGQLRIPYRQVFVPIFLGAGHDDAFLEKNPVGAVPVLELEDGRTVAESNAILCYLAEGTRFLPDERFARAKVLQWLFFEQDYVQPTVATLRHWTLTGKLERNSAGVAGKRRGGEGVLAALERALQGRRFLVGDAPSIADIAVFAYVHLAEDGGFSLSGRPALQRWIETVSQALSPLPEVFPYAIDPDSHRDLPPPGPRREG